MLEFALIAGLFLAISGYAVFRSGRYFGQLFSADHLKIVHQGLLESIEKARHAPTEQPPSPEFGTAFVTYGDIGMGVTIEEDDAGLAMHVSFSQISRLTSAHVGVRVGALVLGTLGVQPADCELFFTESRVHHVRVTIADLSGMERGADQPLATAESMNLQFEGTTVNA